MIRDAAAGVVASLWRYPVKSMQGEPLEEARFEAAGISGDRAYAVIEPASGRVASAKSERWAKLLECRARYAVPSGEGGPPSDLEIELAGGERLRAGAPDLDARLSRALGVGAAALDGPRPADPQFDAAPVHLITSASLERLAAICRLPALDERRFRPNVVVATCEGLRGFVEQDWIGRTIALGEEVRLRIESACERCAMTLLPQPGLAREPRVFETVRRAAGGCFGVYASVVAAGRVRCGDRVRLL